MKRKKAIVLLSGGLDSTTLLYLARKKGYKCSCLIFDYNQRHKKELNYAVRIAKKNDSEYRIVKFSLPWKGSSLLDKSFSIPKISLNKKSIPSTYVSARNIIFLSFAVSFAEVSGASAIFIGANQIDYSGYPDCRDDFFKSFKQMINKGTKNGKKIAIKTPLINLTKAGIIKLGDKLKVPYQFTWSCYRGGKFPCGTCDSCMFRAKGFKQARVIDPLLER